MMTRVHLPKLPHATCLLFVATALISLSSCDTPQTARTSDYASNAHPDGGYNPYPSDRNGVANPNSLLPTNNYGQRVPPPPTGYTPPPIPPSDSSSSRKVVVSAPPPKKSSSTTSVSASAPKKKSTGSTQASGKPKTSTASKPAPKKSSGGGVRTVVQGDSLWAIARRNNTTVEKLKALNGLTSDKLKIGQKIKLP